MRIGELFDIPIRVHWSWLIGFALLTWLIASGGLPFISIQLTRDARGDHRGNRHHLSVLVGFGAHELAHSLTAKRLGYSVVSITLLIFGGVSVIAETRSRSSHDFLIAAAGPGMSLALGIVASILYFVSRDPFATGWSCDVAGDSLLHRTAEHRTCQSSTCCLVYRWMGEGFFKSVIWALTGNRRFAARFAGRAGQLLAVAMMVGAAFMIFARQDLSGGLWLFLIASFILPASTAETKRASRGSRITRETGYPVRSFMSPVPTALNSETPLDAAVRNVISLHPNTAIPVVSNGRVTGTVSLSDVTSLGLGQNQGAGLTVSDVAQQVSTFTVEPDADISQAEELLAKRSIDLLLVFENGYLIGTVAEDDIERVRSTRTVD